MIKQAGCLTWGGGGGVSSSVTSVSVRVSVSSVLEDEDPDQVDQQPGHRNGKQPVVVDVWRLQSSLTDTDRRRRSTTPAESTPESIIL